MLSAVVIKNQRQFEHHAKTRFIDSTELVF